MNRTQQIVLWALAAMFFVLGAASLVEDSSRAIGWIQVGGAVLMTAILIAQWRQVKQSAE